MPVSVLSILFSSNEEQEKLKDEIKSHSDLVFYTEGDKVIKVCSKTEFKPSTGKIVSEEKGDLKLVSITGMTCHRCVKAISDVVGDFPLLAFKIVLDDATGYFVLSEGVEANAIVAIINSMGSKFTAKLK